MGEPGRRTAADRLLAVLAAFDHAASGADADRRSAAGPASPLPTAHRLVGMLTAWGALERDESGAYHIGLRLLELAALAPRGLVLREAAMPFLEDLFEATHENVQLAVRDDAEVVYVERIAGRSAVGVRTQVGARWPLHATGVGLVLLAHSPAGFQDGYLAGAAGSLHRVHRHRAGGACAGCSPRCATPAARSATVRSPTTRCRVAAPVRGPHGDVVASVSVVVPRRRRPARTRWSRPCGWPALGISRALGWQPA